jgi:hypothetical protein
VIPEPDFSRDEANAVIEMVYALRKLAVKEPEDQAGCGRQAAWLLDYLKLKVMAEFE